MNQMLPKPPSGAMGSAESISVIDRRQNRHFKDQQSCLFESPENFVDKRWFDQFGSNLVPESWSVANAPVSTDLEES